MRVSMLYSFIRKKLPGNGLERPDRTRSGRSGGAWKREDITMKLWGRPLSEQESEEAEKKPKLPKIPLRAMMEVLDINNQLIFVGRVAEYARGVVTIRETSDQEVPPVFYNTEVKLHYFLNGENLVLQGMICGSSPYFWRVDRLESQFTSQQRSAFRQRLRLKTQVAPLESGGQGEDEKILGKLSPCELMDISMGGLLMKCRELYQTDDILVFPKVIILPEEAPYSFTCQIRRVNEGRLENQYGCQFQEMPDWEEDRLLKAIFVIQREEIQERKNRGL